MQRTTSRPTPAHSNDRVCRASDGCRGPDGRLFPVLDDAADVCVDAGGARNDAQPADVDLAGLGRWKKAKYDPPAGTLQWGRAPGER